MAKNRRISFGLPKDNNVLKKYHASLEEVKLLFEGKSGLSDDKATKALRICDDLNWTARRFEKTGQYGLAEKVYRTIVAISQKSSRYVESNNPTYDELHHLNKYAFGEGRRVHAARKERVEKYRHGDLAQKIAPTTAIIGLISGIFFLSSNLTGNVIGNSTTSSKIGVVLLLIGIAGAFFYFRRR